MGDILRRVLNKWLEERRKHPRRNDMVDQRISDSIKKIVDELMQKLNNHTDNIAKNYCQSDPEGIITIIDYHKPLCKALMRTFMYMNGLKLVDKGTKKKIEVEEDTEEKSFLKCIVGTTVMLKMLKKYCWFKDYVEYALRITEARGDAAGIESTYNKCSGMDFDQLKIGNILVGETVAKLIKGKDSEIADYGNLQNIIGPWCRSGHHSKVKRKVPRKLEEKEKEWMSESEMKDIVENKQYVPTDKVGTVLEKLGEKMKKKKTPYECPGSTTTEDGSDDKEDRKYLFLTLKYSSNEYGVSVILFIPSVNGIL
ncbi:Uncharacterized protein PCOAH_00009160 [Plasmodium coatneyi]|uniref:Schizont-infected cell agglutination extracellular alpha domain-containing protein n=1 Tax=Plasmodium coatneyi TaxID=208452 RepID=A0A1B1DU93_9APIC|nr:Uncharacterized protein PCOAH_00009160 [Plasmodium coatneyi]ANQ06350.1 Uncharacterized protein PCOAH_00009160 [Plasmodium coatneyi]